MKRFAQRDNIEITESVVFQFQDFDATFPRGDSFANMITPYFPNAVIGKVQDSRFFRYDAKQLIWALIGDAISFQVKLIDLSIFDSRSQNLGVLVSIHHISDFKAFFVSKRFDEADFAGNNEFMFRIFEQWCLRSIWEIKGLS